MLKDRQVDAWLGVCLAAGAQLVRSAGGPNSSIV